MSDTIKQNTIVAIEEESTEGTYVTPSGASSFILPLADGFEMTPAKEVLERNNLNASLFMDASRSGIRSVATTIPVEFKAGDSFAIPEWNKLLESALGSYAAAPSAVTSGTGHTTTVITFADTSDFEVGDIVLVEEAGDYHVSPVVTVTTDTSIELLVAGASAFSDNVDVRPLHKWKAADSGHPSLSITKYVENAVREYSAGSKVTSLALENWTTGQQPTLNFSTEGLSFDRSLTAPSYTPSYDDSKPIIALQACIYIDGTVLGVNELSWSLENTLGFRTTTCSENGRTASRVTASSLTGSLNPYKQDDDISNYTKWLNDTEFSLFGYGYNPTSTSGEFEEIVAFYFPKCQFTEISESDQDGLLQDSLSFKVNKDADGNTAIVCTG